MPQINPSEVVECIFSFLAQQHTSVGEYQIIQHLGSQGVFEPLAGSGPTLSLFYKHFWTMHGLYQLRLNLRGTTQGLTISPLATELVDLQASLSQDLSLESPALSDYYLNVNNIKDATEETVDELMHSFWVKFSDWQSGGDAWSVLGVEKEAAWADVQRAYRRKAQAEHPDKGGSAEAFALYNDAYQKLKTVFDK